LSHSRKNFCLQSVKPPELSERKEGCRKATPDNKRRKRKQQRRDGKERSGKKDE